MGGDHHALLGLEAQQVGRGQVGLGVGLVVPGQLGRQHRVPRDARVLRHVDEQGHVAVRQRRQHVAPLQPRQPLDGVGPRGQAVPGAVQVVELLLGQALEPVLRDQLVEDHPVQVVDLRPPQLAPPHAAHRGAVAAPPVVGERGPVGLDALAAPDRLALPGDARPPVDHRAEDVERHRPHALHPLAQLLPRGARRERLGPRKGRRHQPGRTARQELPPPHVSVAA